MRRQSLEKLEFFRLREQIASEARTAKGRRLLEGLLPHEDLPTLEAELEDLRETMRLLAEAGRPPLPSLEALAPVVESAVRGRVLGIEEVALVKRYLEAGDEVRGFLARRDLVRLGRFVKAIPALPELRGALRRVLTEDGREIRDEASARLREIREAIGREEERLRRLLDALLRRYARAGWLQEELVARRRDRFVFPFKAEAKNRVPGILHDTSASGATVYLEPLEVVAQVNEIERLRRLEEREVFRLLEELSSLVASHRDELLGLEEALGELDSLAARAVFGRRVRGALPRVVPRGGVRLLGAVHPFFPLAGREAVANDFVFPEDKPVVVLSGPNLGGKTVALKTLGLLVLMAHAAVPIPASPDSEIPFYSSVLVDMGDEQDLTGDESTFSAHVKNLRRILEEAGPGRLVLLDEIGRGTDPSEGAALGMAVVEALAESGATVLVTTHYEALKAFSFSRKDVLPLSVTFDEETGRPTYRLLYGVAGLSRGLLLAERLGLPEAIVRRARELLGEGEARFQEVMATLKEAVLAAQREREALAASREALEAEREALSRERARLEAEFRRREAERERRFEEKLRALEEEFRAFLSGLSRQRSSEKKALARFDRFLREKARGVVPPPEASARPPAPGDRVRLRGVSQEGRLLRVKGEVGEVQIGPFRVEVALRDLVVVPDGERPAARGGLRVEAEREVPTTVNLIGRTVEEALAELEKVLDRAFLAGKERLTVIHGLGTGRLMRAVREHLSGHEQVARVRPGRPHEGGEAVTIVELAIREAQSGP